MTRPMDEAITAGTLHDRPRVTPTPDPTPPAPQPARKTPTEFQVEADAFNASLDATMRDLAHARDEVAKCMTARETLIGRATEFGVTAKFARTVLRKG